MNSTQVFEKCKIAVAIGIDLAKDHCDVVAYNADNKICFTKANMPYPKLRTEIYTWSAPQLQGINHIFWVQSSLRARNPKRAPSFNSVAKPHSENVDRLSETPASRVSARIG